MNPPEPRQASLTQVWLTGIACIVIGTFAAVMSWRAGQVKVSPLFLVFVALGVYLVLCAGHVTVDRTFIAVTTYIGRYQLPWNEVKRVEVSASGTLVFHGQGKRLVFPPAWLWSGPDKRALYVLIVDQLRARSLIPERSTTADYKTHKNVRVKINKV